LRQRKKKARRSNPAGLSDLKIVSELFHTMESRQQASLPGHNIATTTDASCPGDAVQTHAFHHGGYSRAVAEDLSTPNSRLIRM